MKAAILSSTDKNHIGEIIDTDLFAINFHNGESFGAYGRLHYGNGRWKLWNESYSIEIEEVRE